MIHQLQPDTKLVEKGFLIDEATLAPDEESCVSIPVCNFSTEPLCLEPGQLLGRVESATIVIDVLEHLEKYVSKRTLCG